MTMIDELTGYAKANADAAKTPDEQQTWSAHYRNCLKVGAEIASLRAALKSILDRYEDQNISHVDFRVGAQRVAASALLRAEQTVRENQMNIYTCTDHDGHWVGVASVVVADNEDQARSLLTAELKTHGLDGAKPFTLRRINANAPRAFILQDGDY